MPRTKKQRHELCKSVYNQNNILKEELLKKYRQEAEFADLNTGNLARIAELFLDPSGSSKADEKNREFLRSISTKEGQARYTKQLIDRVLNMDFSKMFSSDPDVLIDFIRDNYAVLYTAFDALYVGTLNPVEGILPKESLDAFNELRSILQFGGGLLAVVRSYASEEFMEADYENLSSVEVMATIMATHPEVMKKEVGKSQSLAASIINYGKFKDEVETYSKGFNKLIEQGAEITKIGDLTKYQFKNEQGEIVTAGYALEEAGKGKNLSITAKSPEEIEAMDLHYEELPQVNYSKDLNDLDRLLGNYRPDASEMQNDLFGGWFENYDKAFDEIIPDGSPFEPASPGVNALAMGLLLKQGLSAADLFDQQKARDLKDAVAGQIMDKLFAKDSEGKWTVDEAWLASSMKDALDALTSKAKELKEELLGASADNQKTAEFIALGRACLALSLESEKDLPGKESDINMTKINELWSKDEAEKLRSDAEALEQLSSGMMADYNILRSITAGTFLGDEINSDPELRSAIEYAVRTGSFRQYISIDEESGEAKFEIDGIDMLNDPVFAKDLLIRKELESLGLSYRDAEHIKDSFGIDILKEPLKGQEAADRLRGENDLSNTQPIVDRINKVKAQLGQPAISNEQYLALCNENPEYQAYKEVGERFRYLEHFDKYNVPDNNAFARSFRFYLRPEKTDEDRAYNEKLHSEILTQEGQVKLFSKTIQKIAELGPGFLYPQSEQAHFEQFSKDMGFCMTLLSIDSAYETLRHSGVRFAPRIEDFYKNIKKSCEWLANFNAGIVMKSSPYYPAFKDAIDPSNPEYIQNLAIINMEAQKGQGAASNEMQLFSNNGLGYSQVYGSTVNRTVHDMINSGMIPQDIQHFRGRISGNSNPTVDQVILDMDKQKDGAAFIKLYDYENEHIDKQMEKPIVTEKEYEQLAFLSTIVPNLAVANTRLTRDAMYDRIDKTFGPAFVYDDMLLSTRTYTKDKFQMEDYALPENCPFTPHQAALIGIGIFSTDEVAGQERMETFNSVEMRVGANYGFVVENLVSGAPREGMGNNLANAFSKSRNMTADIIRQYMAGNKDELARVLASAVKKSGDTISGIGVIDENLVANAIIADECYHILASDPKLLEIAKNNGYIDEKIENTVKAGKAISDLYTEFMDKGRLYMDKLIAGVEPSLEESSEIVTLNYSLKFIAEHIHRASTEIEYSEVNKYIRSQAEEDFNTKRRLASKAGSDLEKARSAFDRENDPLKKEELRAAVEAAQADLAQMQQAANDALMFYSDLSGKQVTIRDFDDFCIDLGKPGAIDELKKYIASRADIKAIASKDPKLLIEDTHLNLSSSGFKDDVGKEKPFKDYEEGELLILSHYGISPQTIVTEDMVMTNALLMQGLAAALQAAKKDVHLGSPQFDTVERMAWDLYRAESEIGEAEKNLSYTNMSSLSQAHSQTITACDAYLKRKSDQGLLDADPLSKDGKRISAVRALKSHCERTKSYYADAAKKLQLIEKAGGLKPDKEILNDKLKTMTQEQIGRSFKALNELASKTQDQRQFKQIGKQLKTMGEYIIVQNLDVGECGLRSKDFTDASRIIQGIMPEQKAQDEPKLELNEIMPEKDAPLLNK